MHPPSEWPEVGRDALDKPHMPAAPRPTWLPRRRPALGLRSPVAPPVVFILIGIGLGPQAIGLMTGSFLRELELVVSVAFAVLGIFVGLGTSSIPAQWLRVSTVGAAIGSTITILIVGCGLGWLITGWGMPLPLHPYAYAGLVGICASASAAVHLERHSTVPAAAYLADVDDVPLVVLGTAAIAALAGAGGLSISLRLALTLAAGATVGTAGWLLFDRARGPAERGVFVAGAVLLLSGIGAYLGTSPLLTGFVAALVWVRAPGPADRITAADLHVFQHPLVALLLIVAGALIDWSAAVLWVAAAIVVLRLLARLLASFAIAPVLRLRPGVIATALLPPGVMGIALALNVKQVLGSDIGAIVGVVTVATAASEVLAVFLPGDIEERL